ncbi:nodulation protein NoeE (plasmid) [Sulfitobacter alexandrii]|uniref:Nodulation protein NoeE n=1 Tax=Sulfitobacter alexandrii TaxID=1917485 RepID=A0A1J0WP61_9RHOB|nr:sulfotransferase [Sulfitobacter alexandrii]APE46019.1 nodulation protein NoeE [Sulfitobacter alexandrii]
MRRYLFIGGLHRSGTSLLARLVGNHPDISSISGSPAPENEGCYLQGAIPHTALHGRPMHFATDPDQHHIEGCCHDTLHVRERIEADWGQWFDPSRPWRVEKSPVNLTRMRLYQQLFPMSQFLVITRHPEIVAAAVAKWVDGTPTALTDHWIAAHGQMCGDLPYFHAICVIRYEDLCRDPTRTIAGIHQFMGLEPTPDSDTAGIRAGNADYAHPSGLSDAVNCWGYGPGGQVKPWSPIVRHPLRSIREQVVHTLSGR